MEKSRMKLPRGVSTLVSLTCWNAARMPPSGSFFFASRRRHTRYWHDWSSDVCSSDLEDEEEVAAEGSEEGRSGEDRETDENGRRRRRRRRRRGGRNGERELAAGTHTEGEIGRASCRESV